MHNPNLFTGGGHLEQKRVQPYVAGSREFPERNLKEIEKKEGFVEFRRCSLDSPKAWPCKLTALTCTICLLDCCCAHAVFCIECTCLVCPECVNNVSKDSDLCLRCEKELPSSLLRENWQHVLVARFAGLIPFEQFESTLSMYRLLTEFVQSPLDVTQLSNSLSTSLLYYFENDDVFEHCLLSCSMRQWLQDSTERILMCKFMPPLKTFTSDEAMYHKLLKFMEHLQFYDRSLLTELICYSDDTNEMVGIISMLDKLGENTFFTADLSSKAISSKSGGELCKTLSREGLFSVKAQPYAILNLIHNVTALDLLLERGLRMEDTLYGKNLMEYSILNNAPHMVQALLQRGSKLIIPPEFILEPNLVQVIQDELGAEFVKEIPLRNLLPQTGFVNNYLMLKTLRKSLRAADFPGLWKDLIEKSKKQGWIGRPHLECVLAIFCESSFAVFDLSDPYHKKLMQKCRELAKRTPIKANKKSYNLMSTTRKNKILTFCLCVNRLKKELKKDWGKPVDLILIDYTFSATECQGI